MPKAKTFPTLVAVRTWLRQEVPELTADTAVTKLFNDGEATVRILGIDYRLTGNAADGYVAN